MNEQKNENDIFLSVIIPAYNEEKRLPNTLKSTIAYLDTRPYKWELVVVDDGSHDTTVAVVQKEAVLHPQVRILQYGENRGKGFAVRYGMAHTSGKLRLFMDADNSTTIDHIEKFLLLFEQGCDVVIGSRDVPGANITRHQAKWKELFGNVGNMWIQLWAVKGIKDTQAGFKAFTAKAATQIFPRCTIDRWAFDVEVLALARMFGYKISEQPISWQNDPASKVSLHAYWEVFKEVVSIRVNMWEGMYGRNKEIKKYPASA